MNRQASIEITQTDDVGIVRITGRLATGADEAYIDAKTREIKALPCSRLIADLRELDSIGSAGIGFLVDLHSSIVRRDAENKQRRFVLAAPSKRVLEVLTLTGVIRVIPTAPDLESALKLSVAEADKVRTAGS